MKAIQTDNTEQTFGPCRGEYIQFFPTTVFQGKVNLNHTEIANHCRDIVSRCPKGDPLIEYTTYFNTSQREETESQPWFDNFANQMKDTYVEFCRSQYNINFEDVTRNDIHFFAWVNVYNEPHHHEVHQHVKSRLSGTYYVSTDESSEPIKFWNPNMPAIHSQSGNDVEQNGPTEQYHMTGSPAYQTEFKFFPNTGDFLLWPSYLMHSVPQGRPRGKNMGMDRTKRSPEELQEYERISISFNLQHAEDLGAYHHGTPFDYGVLER